MKIALIITLLLAFGAVLAVLLRRGTAGSKHLSVPSSAKVWKEVAGPRDENSDPLQEFFIAPQGESNARAAALLPTTASEDMSHLLVRPKLIERTRSDNYAPDERVEFIVDVTLATKIQKARICGVFDEKWRRKYEGDIYGRDATNGKWSFVMAGDAPSDYNALAFTRILYGRSEDDAATDDTILDGFFQSVREKSAILGAASVSARSTPADGARQSKRIALLHEECDVTMQIVLAAPEGAVFEGRKIWDAMLALGLRWGDMDIFHWENKFENGDDHLFSVWTSTPPGYFFLEEIAGGRVKTRDLIFGFHVARSASPNEVFNAMVVAAEYCARKLGGKLLDANGDLFDSAKVREGIKETVRQLEQEGFAPGADHTLRIF